MKGDKCFNTIDPNRVTDALDPAGVGVEPSRPFAFLSFLQWVTPSGRLCVSLRQIEDAPEDAGGRRTQVS